MSETDELFGFREDGDDGLDIDAIFKESAECLADPPPFLDGPQDAAAAEMPQPEKAPSAEAFAEAEEKAAGTQTKTKSEDRNDPKKAINPEPAGMKESTTTEGSAVSEAEAEPDLFAAFSEESIRTVPVYEAEKTKADPGADQQVSLFDKPAIFKYGSAKEPIKDSSITFEELRIEKADDFPELEEGKKVSWSVKYGDITRTIANPRETTIAKIKEEIEKSKAFLDALKKGKLKDPECFVTPQVRAGSKGIAAYKGVYPTVEAARKSGKIINLIPSSNGKIYELRKTELGEFIAPTGRIKDFSEVRAGFTPALPLIPRELIGQLISFFRSFMSKDNEYEALAFIYWDKQEERFVPHVPRQTASKAFIGYRMEEDALPEERFLHYADIHSHNSMAARFSPVDDADEKATRLYLVVGKLDRFYPDISARVSCGGSFLEIDPAKVIEGIGEEFPAEWLDRVDREEPYVGRRKGCQENPLVSRRLKVVIG